MSLAPEDLRPHPHVNGIFEHPKQRFSKMLSRVDFFENAGLLFSCGRTKMQVFENDNMIE